MAVCAVVGINWGDEGKGRVVDYLAQQADVVVRFQGGSNAGHTVVNEHGEFKLHLLPSGVFNPDALNVLGSGMVIDLEAFDRELTGLESRGLTVPELLVSDRATIVFPFHKQLDALEEDRLADKFHGSTRRGIAPSYGDRYWKKAVQIGELLHNDFLSEHLEETVMWANLLLVNVYKQEPVKLDEVKDWIARYADRIRPYIGDCSIALRNAVSEGKRILFEGQLGALRDIHYGMYPYVTSSCCLTSYARVGGGLLEGDIDRVVGVMKAYSSVVGQGPFVTELACDKGDEIREKGKEFGASTGRPRRMGWFDAVASRYGVSVQGATEIVLTKLDVLSGQERLGVCVAYEVDGEQISEYPLLPVLLQAKPVYEWWPGWDEDISGVREFDQLPEAAQKYVCRLEELAGCAIKSVSVGPQRDAIITR